MLLKEHLNKKLLLVDDEVIILMTLCRDLELAGYDVTSATNGEEALIKLRKDRFDVVITDLVMEEIDGIQVLNEAKRIDPQTPVLILTGYSNTVLAQEAFSKADGFLLKPCDIDDILSQISQCLK